MITKETNKMFLKKGTFRILLSDSFFINFVMFKNWPPNFSFQLASENTLSRILPILRKLVGKAHFWSIGVVE